MRAFCIICRSIFPLTAIIIIIGRTISFVILLSGLYYKLYNIIHAIPERYIIIIIVIITRESVNIFIIRVRLGRNLCRLFIVFFFFYILVESSVIMQLSRLFIRLSERPIYSTFRIKHLLPNKPKTISERLEYPFYKIFMKIITQAVSFFNFLSSSAKCLTKSVGTPISRKYSYGFEFVIVQYIQCFTIDFQNYY